MWGMTWSKHAAGWERKLLWHHWWVTGYWTFFKFFYIIETEMQQTNSYTVGSLVSHDITFLKKIQKWLHFLRKHKKADFNNMHRVIGNIQPWDLQSLGQMCYCSGWNHIKVHGYFNSEVESPWWSLTTKIACALPWSAPAGVVFWVPAL